jgi:hypothetical protein
VLQSVYNAGSIGQGQPSDGAALATLGVQAGGPQPSGPNFNSAARLSLQVIALFHHTDGVEALARSEVEEICIASVAERHIGRQFFAG